MGLTSEIALGASRLRNKNYIINGNFDIWQRGTSFSSPGEIYTADRFVVFASGGNTQVDKVGSSAFTTQDFQDQVGFALQIQPQAGSTTCPIDTRIESNDSVSLLEQNITVSFVCNTNENINLSLELSTPDVSDDWSARTVEQTQIVPITTGDNLVSFTFDPISDQIRRGLSLIIRPQGYSAGTLQLTIANVQLEKGTVATNFEYRPITEELTLCQRYYEKSYDIDSDPGAITNNGAISTKVQAANFMSHAVTCNYTVKKRAIPTVTAYNPVTGTSASIRVGTSNLIASVFYSGDSACLISSGNHTAGIGETTWVHYTADAEL